MGHDIIGDIHGHADRLEALLQHLGFRHERGAWRHPTRTAIFVGDFIDRGPGQLRTLCLVRDMLEAGSAEAVMGNHEFNAIGWASPDPAAPGHHLRPRHGEKGQKNRHQHSAFLSEVVSDSPEHRQWVDWFLALPLWIERRDFRVVHACWDPAMAEAIRPHLDEQNRLTARDIARAHQRGDVVHDAIEVLLKGAEVELPSGHAFTDKDGHRRTAIRTRWWNARLGTYADAYIGPDDVVIPDVPLPARERISEPDRPTFIGHYWLNPGEALRPMSRRVACVDYSVAKGGPLVAYRFEGEAELTADHFVAV